MGGELQLQKQTNWVFSGKPVFVLKPVGIDVVVSVLSVSKLVDFTEVSSVFKVVSSVFKLVAAGVCSVVKPVVSELSSVVVSVGFVPRAVVTLTSGKIS